MQALRIAIVAAEPSGDMLAAGLMAALRERLPDVRFEGVAGPLMRGQGVHELAPMDSLSVMGIFEVLRHLPGLLRLRRRLCANWLASPPDLFIGVDAPDFNLGLARRLRRAGIPTVHYVCPTVWAWREGRVKTIRRSVDLLLSIFPFEGAFLARHAVASHYVGHPLACDMPLQPDREGARAALGLAPGAPVLALLPGSRRSEVARLARPFVQTAAALRVRLPDLQVVVPLVNEATSRLFRDAQMRHAADLTVHLAGRSSHTALAAADVVLTASGTATLEALLSKRPMVVGYKVNTATYLLARVLRLIKAPHVAMANLLSDKPLAPELLQHRCEPEQLLPPLLGFFEDPGRVAEISAHYAAVHQRLRFDTNREAASAVLALLASRGPR